MKRMAVWAVVLAVTISGCASMRKTDVGTSKTQVSAKSTSYSLDVYNSRANSVTVSYSDGGKVYELGPVRQGATEHFVVVSETGTIGHPDLATAEKGEKFLNAIVQDVTRFVDEFTKW